jgi:hypothetical protein
MNRQCPVPKYQRPLSEYNDLKDSLTFAWSQTELYSFSKTLLVFFICLVFLTSIIVTNNYDWEKNKATSLLQIIVSALGIFTLWLLRLYLGWEYIYKRLMNATVTYEESGWYDGQTWIKTNEVLIQDRLIGLYEVLPIMDRLRAIIFISTTGVFLMAYINVKH